MAHFLCHLGAHILEPFCSISILPKTVSKIARYKPEQLNRLMKSKENWLLHEFIAQALDQFIDELAAEITKQDIMNAGQKE